MPKKSRRRRVRKKQQARKPPNERSADEVHEHSPTRYFVEVLSSLPLPLPFNGPNGPQDATNPQQMAHFCLLNFLRFDSDKNNDLRFIVFEFYAELRYTHTPTWIRSDAKVLKKIACNQDELTFFRALALILLPQVRYRAVYDFENTVFCLEEAAELCKSVPVEEKRRPLPHFLKRTAQDTVGDFLADQQKLLKQCIHNQYYGKSEPVCRPHNEIVYVNLSAGNECDNCLKTKAELGRESFLCCARCQFEYYCSEECQRAAWKNGHKEKCRAKGDYRPGDQVVDGTAGVRVALVEKMDQGDDWVVSDSGGRNVRTMSTRDFRRLRPALWHCPATVNFFNENPPDVYQQKLKELQTAKAESEKNYFEGSEPTKEEPEEPSEQLTSQVEQLGRLR